MASEREPTGREMLALNALPIDCGTRRDGSRFLPAEVGHLSVELSACARAGWAVKQRDFDGRIAGWRLTDAGREVLAAARAPETKEQTR